MAQSITVAASLKVGSGFIYGTKSATATQTGEENFGGTQSIATNSTTIELGNVNTIGPLYIENLDATNYVEVDGVNTFDSAMCQKILAGGFILLRPKTTTLYAKANTAAVSIKVAAAEL